MAVDIPGTFGALFIGGIVAILFSGVVTSQAFAYFKYYPNDLRAVKILAGFVWFLDFFHSIWVTVSLWDHLIEHFGDEERIDYIPWSLALTIAFTAILTFLVHLFFVYRIFKLSHNNYYIAIPLALIASARLAFACLTTATMIQLRSLHKFVELYTWSFTTGLTLSSALDVFITLLLCYMLLRNQKANSSMNHILDRLMLYTFENGSLTTAATLASLICWLTNKSNLVFMGLHFVISKFYANSLFATLNTRKSIHRAHYSHTNSAADRNLAVMFHDAFTEGGVRTKSMLHSRGGDIATQQSQDLPVQIKVDQNITSHSDSMLLTTMSDPEMHLQNKEREHRRHYGARSSSD